MNQTTATGMRTAESIPPGELVEGDRGHLGAASDHERGRNRHVLVVDDDPVQLKLLRVLLVQEGFSVDAAGSGDEALTRLRNRTPDAVVSDICMPGMDGFELCLQIRRSPGMACIPVVLTSSMILEDAEREMAFTVGATVLVPKSPGGDLLVPMLAAMTVDGERVELRRQAHLDDRLRTVGTLATGIAHEINNPASFMLANLEYLGERIAKARARSAELSLGDASQQREQELDGLLAEMARVVDETREGGGRIRDIVRGLKSFARSDEPDGGAGSICVHGMLDTALGMASHQIRSCARLEKDYAIDLPRISGDAGRIGQVFVNLLMNAAQAIGEGDPDGNAIRISARADGPYVRIEVADSGPGIPPGILPRIFDPFFTTKPAGVGTGLGLSICHEIVSALGGEIHVRTAPGQGTTFSVQLPQCACVPVRTPDVVVSAKPVPRNRLRVLMVDDEPYVLKAFERLFGRRYRLTLAPDGRAALEVLAKHQGRFDAILSDLSMPEVDGEDLHRFVSERYPELASRMVFMTGGAFTERSRAFLAKVDNPRLEKPFDSAHACDVIDAVCARAEHAACDVKTHAAMSA